MPGVPGQRARGSGVGRDSALSQHVRYEVGLRTAREGAGIIGDGPRLPDRPPHVATTSKRGDYAAAIFDVSTNCDTHLLRRFRLARYISSNSAGGKECVDGRRTVPDRNSRDPLLTPSPNLSSSIDRCFSVTSTPCAGHHPRCGANCFETKGDAKRVTAKAAAPDVSVTCSACRPRAEMLANRPP